MAVRKNMKTAVILSAVFSMMMAEGASQRCVAHHECNANQFCYKTGYCADCTDCKIYNRQQPHEYPKCPESAQECGSCFPGFKEQILIEGEMSDRCDPVEHSQNNGDQNLIIIISFGILILIFVICSFFFFFRCKRTKERNQNASNANHNRQDEHVEDVADLHNVSTCSPPPQYDQISHFRGLAVQYGDTSPTAPLLPPSEPRNTESITEQVEMDLHYVVNEKELVNFAGCATPFQYPDSSYNENLNINNNEDEEDSEEEVVSPEDEENTAEVGEASPPPLDDDSTMESHWTPGLNYGQETSENASAAPNSSAAVDTIDEEVSTPPMDKRELGNGSTNNLYDSGISGENSTRTSSSSLERPFSQFGRESTSSREEPHHGITRIRSEDELRNSDIPSKRMRTDTQSIDEGNVSDV